MKITLPLTVSEEYESDYNYTEIKNILNNLTPEIKIFGIKTRQHNLYEDENNKKFTVSLFSPLVYNSSNQPVSTLYMRIEIKTEYPTTLNLKFIPNYFAILFLLIFVVIFIPGAFFAEKWTINDVYRTPTVPERFLFSLAGIIPGVWCYIQFIRPIKRTKNWIIKKMRLRKILE